MEEPLSLAQKLLDTIDDTEPLTVYAALALTEQLFTYRRKMASKKKIDAMLEITSQPDTSVPQGSAVAGR
jgi:hypothetical protein